MADLPPFPPLPDLVVLTLHTQFLFLIARFFSPVLFMTTPSPRWFDDYIDQDQEEFDLWHQQWMGRRLTKEGKNDCLYSIREMEAMYPGSTIDRPGTYGPYDLPGKNAFHLNPCAS
jgi:hypothetical protein